MKSIWFFEDVNLFRILCPHKFKAYKANHDFANYKKERIAWDNLGSWQFGVQRLGSGLISQTSTEKIPFQKAIVIMDHVK